MNQRLHPIASTATSPVSWAPRRPVAGKRAGASGASHETAAAKSGPPLAVLVVAHQGGARADGGTESLTQLLERYRGVQVTVLTQMETAKTERWRKAGCRVIVRKFWHEPGRSYGPLRWRAPLYALQILLWNLGVMWLAWRTGAKAAHANDPFALWHSVFGLRLLGIPTVLNIRDTKHRFTRVERLKWRAALRLTQAQIVLSREMGEFWRRAAGSPAPRLFAVYSVVDFDRMRPAGPWQRARLRDERGLAGTFAVGYVASFSEKKAQLKFILQAGPLLKRTDGPRVHFLGDFDPENNAYARACRDAVEELGLGGQFCFHGYTPRMEEWYPALDAVVVATQNEGLARCMIEGLACGTPVVSFDVCSAREILEQEDARCGFVARQGDYAALVRALEALAGDEALRGMLSAHAVAVARRSFRADRNVARYLATYEALASGGTVL